MSDDIVTRLKRELEEIRRSGYGHDWPLSQAIAVIEDQQAENERLRALIGQVLDCPVNHQGCRSITDSVIRYTAKRIDDSLLDALKHEARRGR